MAEIKFKIKVPVDINTQKIIVDEIKDGNEESKKQWHKVAKTFNRRFVRYTVGLTDFGKYIAMSGEYFSDADTITEVIFRMEEVIFVVDESFMEMLQMGSDIGADKLAQALAFISNKAGIKMEKNKYNKKGFTEYLENELKIKGVILNGGNS